jgi:hypothetical protein
MGYRPKCEIAIDYEYERFTHPLPRTVLTVSKRGVRLLRQNRPELFCGREQVLQQDQRLRSIAYRSSAYLRIGIKTGFVLYLFHGGD